MLLVVLQVYLHQIINLNTKVLKVLQVSLERLVRDYYVWKKSNFITSLPPHAYIHKMIYLDKRKIKYRTILYLYLKEVRLIKNTGLEHSNTCKQRELLNPLFCSVEKTLHSSTIVAIYLSCVKPSQFSRNNSCLCNVQKQSSIGVL